MVILPVALVRTSLKFWYCSVASIFPVHEFESDDKRVCSTFTTWARSVVRPRRLTKPRLNPSLMRIMPVDIPRYFILRIFGGSFLDFKKNMLLPKVLCHSKFQLIHPLMRESRCIVPRESGND